MHNSTIQYSYSEWTAKIHPSVESERIKRKWNTENDDNRNFYSIFFLLSFFAFGMFVFITSIWLLLLLMLLVLLLRRPKWILVVVQLAMMLESRGSLRFCIAWELCLFSSIVRFISVHTFTKMFNAHIHSSHTALFGWIWCELSEKGQFSISTF